MGGINRLARAMDSRMKSHAYSPPALELGTIQSDGSLKLDTFSATIPKSDYLILRHCTLPNPMATASDNATVPRPSQLAPPVAGDRVLCAWINGDSDIVVLDVVVSANG